MRSFGEPLDGYCERGCLHVVRVAAKAVVAPAHVGRILAGMAQAAQFRHRPVFDGLPGQFGGKRIGVYYL